MKHLISKGVVAVILLVTGAARGQEKPFKSLEGGFSVQFPGQPKYEANKLPGTNITQHQFLHESKDGTVAHLTMYHVDAGFAGLSKEEKQKRLIAARDGARQSLNGKLLDDKAIELAGHPGREFKVTAPEFKAEYRSRVYIVDDRLYQVMLMGPREVTASKEADAFLQSFKLLETSFKSLEGGFSVQFPGQPKHKAMKLPGTNITEHQFLYESKDGTVAHVVGYQVDAGLAGLSKEEKQKGLIAARDAVRQGFNGKLLDDKVIELAGHPGREFKVTVPEIKAEYRSRIYIVGDRLYQIALVGPPEVTASKGADAFLESFKLLEAKK